MRRWEEYLGENDSVQSIEMINLAKRKLVCFQDSAKVTLSFKSAKPSLTLCFVQYAKKKKMQIYFTSITQEVIAHSPELEAHDQSVRHQIELEFRSRFLWREENQSTQRKTLEAQERTNKLYSHIMPGPGIDPRP